MNALTFTVYGTPQPKGSTRAFARMSGGRPIATTTSANPALKGWESLVRHEAQGAMRRHVGSWSAHFDGAVSLSLTFGLVRPASVSIRKRPYATVKPDLDKLVRGTIDALDGLIRDDAQVVEISASKHYVPSGPPFAEITINPFQHQ